MPDNQEHISMPHDTGYKYLLSSKKAFIQLVRSFIKTGWAEQIDEADLVRIDKSFILQDFKNKEADTVEDAFSSSVSFLFYIVFC